MNVTGRATGSPQGKGTTGTGGGGGQKGTSGLTTGNQDLQPMLPDPNEGLGFGGPNVRPVSGANPLQMWSAYMMPSMYGPSEYQNTIANALNRGMTEGRRTVTGAGLPGGPGGTNPSFEATKRAFEAMTIPEIRQQRTLMGLGDSNAVTKDIAGAWAGVLPTLVENELGREERSIDRSMGSAFTGAGGYQNLDTAGTARKFNALTGAWEGGAGLRDIAEQGNRAVYEDFLRRQGLAENLLFAPFGQTGNSIGNLVSQGGLFK
jgi:hypothetical protein